MKVAIVGIRGIPNNYGGFETLAENLVKYLSKELELTVYCSSKDMPKKLPSHSGANLKYIPITSHGGLGIIYDSISLLSAIRNNDKILFLGFGCGFVMPIVKKKEKIIVNIGGLDWQRSKWSGFAQKVIKFSEKLLLRNAGSIISDNVGIQKYIKNQYKRNSSLIAYGGDQAQFKEITNEALKNYPFLKSDYALAVARIQPDNNIDMILEAFQNQSKIPLVFIGNWQNSPYGKNTKKKYLENPNLILLEAIYDRSQLDIIRSNCTIYIHGHSAGGTNPSLVEAMYLRLPIFAFSSGYNEFTSENKAFYFKNKEELVDLIENYKNLNLNKIGQDLFEIAESKYRWEMVASKYLEVIKQ